MALEIKVCEHRHVAADVTRSHEDAAYHYLPDDQVEALNRHLDAGPMQADEIGRAPGTDHPDGLLGGWNEPVHLESVVHPATGQLMDPCHRIIVLGGDEMRGTKLLRHGLLFGGEIDRDDLPRTGEARAGNRVEADATHANDRNRIAAAHLGGVDHRAGARDDATAQQRSLRKWQFRGNQHQLVLMHQRTLGKACRAPPGGDRCAVTRKTGHVVRRAQGFLRIVALERAGGAARVAMAARLGQRADHMIANGKVAHLRPDRPYDARDLMAENGG
nr:hypothetical protein [Ancylobacter oerskovii]